MDDSSGTVPPGNRSRLASLAPVVIFDTAGPLITYSLLRSHGSSTVAALVLSGVVPAFGVTLGFVRHRRLDAIGALVLAGIAAGTAVGLATHDPRLVLIEGRSPPRFSRSCAWVRCGHAVP